MKKHLKRNLLCLMVIVVVMFLSSKFSFAFTEETSVLSSSEIEEVLIAFDTSSLFIKDDIELSRKNIADYANNMADRMNLALLTVLDASAKTSGFAVAVMELPLRGSRMCISEKYNILESAVKVLPVEIKKSVIGLEVASDIYLEESINRIYQDRYRAKKENIFKNTFEPEFQIQSLWGLNIMRVPEAWEKTVGSHSIYAVVMDTGVDFTHSQLKDNRGVDLDGNCGILSTAKPEPDDGPELDEDGHGTHVAGTIGGSLGVGVNKKVSLLSVKIFSPKMSKSSNVAIGLNYILDQKQRGLNIRVVNCSFMSYIPAENYNETTHPTSMLYNAVSDLGVVIVAAGGNEGKNFDISTESVILPAGLKLAKNHFSVGAASSADSLAGFSNRGKSFLDVVAPGVNVTSTIPGNGYDQWEGTSMAAPHISGLTTLIAAGYPMMKPGKCCKIIEDSIVQQEALREYARCPGIPDAYVCISEGLGDSPVEGIIIDTNSLSMKKGQRHLITADILPENARNIDVVWESNNKAVANVDEFGTVFANDPGRAVLTATTADGNFSQTCFVLVEEPKDPTESSEGGCSTGSLINHPLQCCFLLLPIVLLFCKRENRHHKGVNTNSQ